MLDAERRCVMTGVVPRSNARHTAEAEVIARRATTAHTAATAWHRDGPHRHDHRLRVLVEVDILNDRARESTRALPSALVPHPPYPYVEAVE